MPTKAERLSFWLLLALVVGQCQVNASEKDFVSHGLIHHSMTTVDGAQRVRGLGPIYERRVYEDGRHFFAIRPFYCELHDPARERILREYLWPVGTVKKLGPETYWRFLLFFGRSDRGEEEYRWHFWALPFLMFGDRGGEGTYASVFPLGGTMENFLGRDRTTFAVFPLYAHSVIGERQSTEILWPFISWTRDEGLSKFRVLPFYGREFVEGEYRKQFVMWPIWSQVEYTGGDVQGSGFVLFPIIGHTKLTDQETWMLIPPLIRWSKSDEVTQVYAPWPFVQYFRGEINKTYLWPLWGHKWTDVTDDRFFLWPFFSASVNRRHDLIVHQHAFRPFIYRDKEFVRLENGDYGEQIRSLTKVWPIYYKYEEEDTSYLRILDLWPTKHSPGVDRNLAPFWTLYSRHRKGDERESALLWGLYHRRIYGAEESESSVFPIWDGHRAPGRRGWSLFKGLVGYEREGDVRSLKLLYFLNIGGQSSAQPQQ